MEQKTGIIYRAYDSEGKSYVGQTIKGLEHRKKAHEKSRLQDDFHKALKEKEFKWEVLEDNIPENELNEREKYWIAKFDSFKNGYNNSSGGETSYKARHCKHSKKTIELLRNKSKGNTNTRGKHWKISVQSKQKGKKFINNGVVEKMIKESELQDYLNANWSLGRLTKGRIPWNKGKPASEETCKKMSQVLKGKTTKGKHWKLVNGKRVYY